MLVVMVVIGRSSRLSRRTAHPVGHVSDTWPKANSPQLLRFRRSGAVFYLVGDTGFEPVTSSV